MECTIEKRMKNPVKNNLKVCRRDYVRYAGAGVAAVAAAAAGAYYFVKLKPSVVPITTQTPAETLTATQTTTVVTKETTVTSVTAPINPVIVEYGDKFPPEVVEKIKVLGEDYKINENERILLDNLYDIELKRGELEKDFDCD